MIEGMQPRSIASISLIVLFAYLVATPCAADDAPGRAVTEQITLFNGRDLTGWTTWLVDTKREDPRGVFSVTDDKRLRISGDGFGYLVTRQSYRDYRLVVEYRWGKQNWRSRVGKARDSGVFVHVSGPDGNSFDGNGAFKAGIECQVMEGATGDIMLIRGKDQRGREVPLQATAEIAERRDAENWPYWSPGGERQTLKQWGRINWHNKDSDWRDTFGFRGPRDLESKPGEWTRLEITCDEDRTVVEVNGTKVNEVEQVHPTGGQILLQCEGSEVYFRKVELLPIPTKWCPRTGGCVSR